MWGDKRRAYFSVEDQGKGIPADEIKNLFGSFYRSKDAQLSGKPGTGMGLTLTKEIVDKHKGKSALQVKSVKGRYLLLNYAASSKRCFDNIINLRFAFVQVGLYAKRQGVVHECYVIVAR